MYLGLVMLTRFAVACGALTEADAERIRMEAWTALRTEAAVAGAERADESPARVFLALLADGLASRKGYVEAHRADLDEDPAAWGWGIHTYMTRDGEEQTRRHAPGATLLGWLDEDWVLLIPEATYQFVATAARAAGQVFPVEKKTLLRRLDEARLIATAIEDGHTRREVKVRVGTATKRVIRLRQDALQPTPPPVGGTRGDRGAGTTGRRRAGRRWVSPHGRRAPAPRR